MLLSSTEMSGGGEWRIVMALNAEIVAISMVGVIRTPVVRVVVIIVTSIIIITVIVVVKISYCVIGVNVYVRTSRIYTGTSTRTRACTEASCPQP